MQTPRSYCYRCDRPESMCLCGHLAPLPNRVGVHVLQHPKEARHPLGTVRLLRLGLASVRVHVLKLQGRGAASAPVALPAGAGLLYPSPEAQELSDLSPQERPRHLVVLDGTWAQAHRIYQDNPWVSSLPCYRLTPAEGSRYRIRAEPRQECLSTLESTVAALRHLEPELQGTEGLLTAFDAMIDGQIEASARPSSHAQGKAKRAPRPIPPVLCAPGARVVVVYTEAALGGGVARVCAASLDGTRRFDRMVRGPTVPDAFLSDVWGVSLEAVAAAEPLEAVVSALRASFDEGSPGLVWVSWAPRTQVWLRSLGLPCVLLKGVWSNLHRSRIPGLDRLVAERGLSVQDLGLPGRGGRRLALALAVARQVLAPHARS